MAIKTPQKFTKEELEQIKELQVKITNITTQMGQLYLTKLKLKDQEKLLMSQLSSIEKEEKTLAEKLTEKYGKGSLNVDSGDFTPTK
jgi:hypothetical protein